MRLALATICVALYVLSPRAAAQLVVGPAGSGAPFDEIAAALEVALPGDVILVAPGNYAPIVVDTPVTILGSGAGQTVIPRSDDQVGIAVTGIAAGEEARIAGLSVINSLTSFTSVPSGPLIAATDNAGRVAFSAVVVGGTADAADGPAAVQVADTALCLLQDCEVFGSQPSLLFALVPPQPAVRVERSTLLANGSTLVGGSGGFATMTTPQAGATGLEAVDAALVLAKSVVLGGDGGVNSDPLFGSVQPAGDGIELAGSSLVAAGGPGNEIRGGMGASADLIGGLFSSDGGAGLALDGGSTTQLAADVVIAPGPDGDATVSQPGIDAATPSSVTLIASSLPSSSWSPSIASVPSSVTLATSGQPGALHATFLSTGLTAPLPIAGVFGEAFLDPSTSQPLTTATPDATGSTQAGFDVPANPALIGVTVHVQTLQLDGSSLSLGIPASLSLAR